MLFFLVLLKLIIKLMLWSKLNLTPCFLLFYFYINSLIFLRYRVILLRYNSSSIISRKFIVWMEPRMYTETIYLYLCNWPQIVISIWMYMRYYAVQCMHKFIKLKRILYCYKPSVKCMWNLIIIYLDTNNK